MDITGPPSLPSPHSRQIMRSLNDCHQSLVAAKRTIKMGEERIRKRMALRKGENNTPAALAATPRASVLHGLLRTV